MKKPHPCLLAAISVFAFAGPSAHAAVNHRPTISPLVDQRITSGSFANQAFVIGDAETPAASLSVSATSSNTGWYPNGNITVTGTKPNLTLNFTTPGSNGATTITVTVTDGGGKSTATSFTLQRAAAGTAPVIQGIADIAIPVNGSYGTVSQPLPLVVKDHNNVESTLSLSASSSNTTLVPNGNIVFGGQNWGRNVRITPASGQSGRTTITLTASDGTNTASTSFVLDVVNGSTPPTFSNLPTFRTLDLGDTPSGMNFTIGDAETAAADLRVTATSSNTTLVPNANLALSGTTGTRTITVTPAAGVTGASTITLALSDGDIVRRATFLFVVHDPSSTPLQIARSNGVYILDSNNGPAYTTTFGKAIQLRTQNMRSHSFVTGFTLRVDWADVESSTTPGDYDFHLIDNALGVLPSGQTLSLIFHGSEPAYIAAGAATTWNDGGTTRAVPWDSYLRTRRAAFIAALAAHTTGGVPLAVNPRLLVLDPYLPGGHTGLRDPNGTKLRDMSGYTRQGLLDTVIDELTLLQDHFPGKVVQIGFWPITDYSDASYGGVAAHEWIRQQLLAEFDGENRPLVGFFMENLAARRDGAAIEPFTATPITSYAVALYNSRDVTWNGFQMLGNWTRPFNDNHVDNTLNGTPNDAIEYAYNTYRSRYAEVYITDIDNPAMQPALQSWHDYFVSLAAPEGLTALPVSPTQIDVEWNAVAGATSYTLQRQTGTGAFTTIYGGATPSFSDTGRSPSTDYAYRVRATTSSGTTAFSAPFPATTFAAASTLTVKSIGAEDGYVTASGVLNATLGSGSGIRAGEGSGSNQQKGILSFDTSALPDGATILSVTLRIKQGSLTSTPFATLGTCSVDIKSGHFGASAALQSDDFSAAAGATGVATLPDIGVGNWAEETLSAGALAHVNKTGKTQIRIQFGNGAVSNVSAGWFPGENSGQEPELVVEYQ